MGLLIKINDASFTNHVGYVSFPGSDALKCLLMLGGTNGDSIKDQSGNGNDGTIVGSIALSDKYATFSGSGVANRIDLPVVSTSEKTTTVVALCRVTDGLRYVASTYNANAAAGFSMTNNSIFAISDGNTNKNFVFNSALSKDCFNIVAWSINQSGCRVVRDVGGMPIEAISANDNIAEWGDNIVIGGCKANLSMNADLDLALVAVYEGEVTDDYLKEAFEYIRQYAERSGLAVV